MADVPTNQAGIRALRWARRVRAAQVVHGQERLGSFSHRASRWTIHRPSLRSKVGLDMRRLVDVLLTQVSSVLRCFRNGLRLLRTGLLTKRAPTHSPFHEFAKSASQSECKYGF